MRTRKWTPYASVFRLRARLETQYRAAALGGLVTQAFFGSVLVCLYTALFDGNDPRALQETVTYVWLQQMFFRMLLNNDSELNGLIMTGGIAYTMIRPIDQHAYWMMRELATRLVGALMRLIPMVLLQFILPASMRMTLPESPVALMQFMVSLVLGAVILSEISGVRDVVIMKTLDTRGISAMINLIQMIFSGNIIPLTLFPDKAQALIRYQPFAQALDAPSRMYLHAQSAPEWLFNLSVQLGWIVLIAGLGRLLWARQMNRMTVQGG
ncbi:MAG: ABC-2 family transporter protein [Christensenellaceae bacterium]|nr:ABC-2 family transporter protein [Christensenellaceae bacterium]